MEWTLVLALAFVPAGGSPFDAIELRSIEIAQVATDRVKFLIHLGGMAKQDLTLQEISFENVTADEIPLFLPSVAGRFAIAKGGSFQSLGPLQATVFFRDFESLEPFRAMVRSGKADVKATIRLRPELSLMQRVVLRAAGVWVSTQFQRTLPVQLPGGVVGRSAALMALAGADAVWLLGRKGANWRSSADPLLDPIRAEFLPRVVIVSTRYETQSRSGVKTARTGTCLGIIESGGSILAPAGAALPWLFDAAIAEALAAKELAVVEGSVIISARTGKGEVLALKAIAVAEDKSKAISMQIRKVYPFRRRDSSSNIARFSYGGPSHAPLKVAPPAAAVDTAAVFRLREGTSIELLALPAKRDGDGITLLAPVDARAFGSPVIVPGGVAGMVAHHTRVVSMKEASERLRKLE